jgi:hypothetical protein
MAIIAIAPTYGRGQGGRPSGSGGGVSWLTPRGVPGFTRRVVIRPGTPHFQGLMGLAIAAGRRGLGVTDPCGNTGEVIGPNGQCTLPQYLPSNYQIVNPTVPAVPGAVAVALYRSNPAYVGGCPVIDPKNNLCAYGGGTDTIGCNELRECDGIVGTAIHYAYALPGGADPNVDITVVGGSGKTYQGNPINPAYMGPAAAIAAAATAGQSPTGGGGATGSTSAGTGGTVAVPVTLTFTNTSRAGMPLQVGDSWSLTIMGSANTPVTADATQNGKLVANGTAFGSTDASGKRVLTGVMTADTVGQWQETFHVGSQSAQLSFTVASASAGKAPPPPDQTGGGGSTSTDSSGGSGDGGVSSKNVATCFSIFPSTLPASLVKLDTCIGPVSLLTAAALLAAGFFMFGGKRR